MTIAPTVKTAVEDSGVGLVHDYRMPSNLVTRAGSSSRRRVVPRTGLDVGDIHILILDFGGAVDEGGFGGLEEGWSSLRSGKSGL